MKQYQSISEVVHRGDKQKERGASLVEYTLLVALIAIVAILGVRKMGEATHNQYAEIVNKMGGAKIAKK